MESAPAPLWLRLFGPFEARVGGEPLRLRSRRGSWLLALLVLHHGRARDRKWLAGTVWPESAESAARENLRTYLVDLRRVLATEAWRLSSPTPHTLCLDLAGADVDLLTFDAAIAAGDISSLERAIALYRGPLLENCVELWVTGERGAREQAYLATLETMAAHALERGEPAAAERYLRLAVATDCTRESAQRALMRALVAQGSYAAAVEAYQAMRSRLHQELNAEPDPETKALFQQFQAEGRRRAAVDWSPVARDPLSPPAPAAPLNPEVEAPTLPEGTLTFLFTDIEGSTGLWEQHEVAMEAALARHDAILQSAVEAHGGRVFKKMGDAFCAVFATAPAALAAALSAQCHLLTEVWPFPSSPESRLGPPRVRIALHTGEAQRRGEDYYGQSVNRVARLLAAGYGGQILLSQATQAMVCDHLPGGSGLRDLGKHHLKGFERTERIFQLTHPELPDLFPPLPTAATTPNNLPRQLTLFIGRKVEIAEVRRLLGSAALLTLTGAGGFGKTRLALQVVEEVMEAYADGAWLVELGTLTEPALVPQAVGAALGVREEPGRALTEMLINHLRQKKLLLLLDNCEHLARACAILVYDLLRACPELRVLATSREALGVPGEAVWCVPSLSLPDPGAANSDGDNPASALCRSDATRLFIERARLAKPEFGVTGVNSPLIEQICRRLDGMPLAIELAAARAKTVTVEQIAARLDDRFRLLIGGSRVGLPHHQTLRAAIDWSYDLLEEPERALLRRVSIFAGSFGLEAAEDVCGDDGCGAAEGGGEADEAEICRCSAAIGADEVLDGLSGLVDKSLVLVEEQGPMARYRLLETIREYGAERLREAGGETRLRDRHRDWYLDLAERAEPELEGSCQQEWLERLELEHDNLRAAIAHSVTRSDPQKALRFGAALWRFWDVRGHLAEGSSQLRVAIDQGGAIDTPERARALNAAGALAHSQGHYARAERLHRECLDLAGRHDDRRTVAKALNHLGNAIVDQGRAEEAGAYYGKARDLCRELGDGAGEVKALINLGAVEEDCDRFEQAVAFYEECVVLSRALSDKSSTAIALNNLGHAAIRLGERERAAAVLTESLALSRQLADKYKVAMSLTNLAELAEEEGDIPRAAALHGECLGVCHELDHRPAMAASLEGLAGAAAARGRGVTAARLYGAAEALREGAPQSQDESARCERKIASVRPAMDEAAWQSAWAEGRAMPLGQAVEVALEEAARGDAERAL